MPELPRFRVTVVILIFLVSTGYVLYILFAYFRTQEQNTGIDGLQMTCPTQPICESSVLVEDDTSTNEENIPMESLSTVHVCGIVRIASVFTQRFPDEELVVDVLGRRFFYHFIHVFGKGDKPPTDKKRRHVLMEEDGKLSPLKFLRGMEYYQTADHRCDAYFYVQDDVTLNFVLLSFIINKATPISYVGSYITTRDMSKDPKFKEVTERTQALPYMRDPFFVMGSELAECSLREINKKYLDKGWENIAKGEYYAMGSVIENCEKDPKNVHHVFMCAEQGYDLNSARNPSGDGYLLIQMKFPARDVEDHISQLL